MNRHEFPARHILPLLLFWLGPVGAATSTKGKQVVERVCAACHKTGVQQAPRLGNYNDWKQRMPKGDKVLISHALQGFKAMPPKGGNPNLTEEEVTAAVHYMVEQVIKVIARGEIDGQQAKRQATTSAGSIKIQKSPDKPDGVKAKQGTSSKSNGGPGTGRVAVVINKPAKGKPRKNTSPRTRTANRFNRLLRPPSKRNLPPTRDGIHDPSNQGTHILQPPKEAFSGFPKAHSGNRVDWVQALEKGVITPRFDRLDPNKKPVVLDLNIVREVKGSMPDVVYPHKQHTEWLDCSNCHPAIFIPKKGANNISMASILLGKDCGVCHGKVAFPVAECRKCHSKRKPKKAHMKKAQK